MTNSRVIIAFRGMDRKSIDRLTILSPIWRPKLLHVRWVPSYSIIIVNTKHVWFELCGYDTICRWRPIFTSFGNCTILFDVLTVVFCRLITTKGSGTMPLTKRLVVKFRPDSKGRAVFVRRTPIESSLRHRAYARGHNKLRLPPLVSSHIIMFYSFY